MGLPDKHDERLFRHFAKLAADGSVAAIVEVADGSPDPVDADDSLHVDVTHLHPYDFSTVTVKAKDVKAAKRSGDHAVITAALSTALVMRG